MSDILFLSVAGIAEEGIALTPRGIMLISGIEKTCGCPFTL